MPTGSVDEALSSRVKNYLINHFAEQVDNQVLANYFHLHPNSITRKFKKSFHVTPKQYLNEYRLLEAAKRLQETNQTVEKIAGAVGYQNVYYFSKQFKKRFHLSPSEFRRQARQCYTFKPVK